MNTPMGDPEPPRLRRPDRGERAPAEAGASRAGASRSLRFPLGVDMANLDWGKTYANAGRIQPRHCLLKIWQAVMGALSVEGSRPLECPVGSKDYM